MLKLEQVVEKTTLVDLLREHNIKCTVTSDYGTFDFGGKCFYYDKTICFHDGDFYTHMRQVGDQYVLAKMSSEELKLINGLPVLWLDDELYIIRYKIRD